MFVLAPDSSPENELEDDVWMAPEKEIVWEYILADSAQRVFRYPYDDCEPFGRLPPPRERAVVPPAELRIEPKD